MKTAAKSKRKSPAARAVPAPKTKTKRKSVAAQVAPAAKKNSSAAKKKIKSAAPATSVDDPFLIGTLRERSLHAHLKRLYTEPGDLVEEKIEGYWVDIRRGEAVIEIQTGSFGSMKKKLTALLPTRPVRIVHPVAVEKWITKVAKDGTTFVNRRKSPKRGSLYDLFDELVSFPHLILDPNFSVEVVLVKEEELRCEDGHGSWRRKGTSIKDHILLEVSSRDVFHSGRDFLRLLPPAWTGPSTNRELAKALKVPYFRIARMTYCLVRMEMIRAVGKVGNSVLFELIGNPALP